MLDLTNVDADSAYHNWLEANRIPHMTDRQAAFNAAWNILSEFIAGPEQKEVDWSVVREAVNDAADYDGLATGALEASFKTCGLLVVHRKDAAPASGTDCKNEGAPVGAAGECLACPSEAGETCQRIKS